MHFKKEPLKKNLLDNRKQCFEKLDEDLIAVLQLKAYIVRLYPRQILKHTHINISFNLQLVFHFNNQ